MKTINFTEFRKNASALISDVENGETVELIRHGKAIAKISPISHEEITIPAWKKPGLRLAIKGDGLSNAILQEREIS